MNTPDAPPTPAPAPTPSLIPAKPHPNFLQLLPILLIASLLIADRLLLATKFLFKYFDQDQALLWFAAHEFLHGRLHEPCFYGQTYNSCLESFLAAPLIALNVPDNIALPSISITLALLPFFLLALFAFKRKQPLLAALSLLLPLILPVRYAILTGLPRGFVTGIALAIIPALLAIAPAYPIKKSAWRFFFIAFLSLIAIMLNPGCVLLLIAVAIYALARYPFQWKFWLFTPLGLLAAAPYPYFVHLFYYVWHDDYRLHHRDMSFPWTFDVFMRFVRDELHTFSDLVPMGIPAQLAAPLLALAFAGLTLTLLVRLKIPTFLAAFAAISLTIASFAYSRLQFSYETVYLPYSRNFLALPVLFLWLILAAGAIERPSFLSRAAANRITLTLLALMLSLALVAFIHKQKILPTETAAALDNSDPMEIAEISEARQLAAAVETTVRREHAPFLLLTDSRDKKWDYYLPLFTSADTLFARFERRTWRMHEENHPRYARILTLDPDVYYRARQHHYPHLTIANHNPQIFAFDTQGKSVIDICNDLQIYTRHFDPAAP